MGLSYHSDVLLVGNTCQVYGISDYGIFDEMLDLFEIDILNVWPKDFSYLIQTKSVQQDLKLRGFWAKSKPCSSKTVYHEVTNII